MSSPVIEQSLTASGSGTSISLASWTPGANELVLVGVFLRDETISPTVSGNGLTFVEIANVDNVQAQTGVNLFRAMGASPTTGAITVTLSGNTKPAVVIVVRISGVDTSGTNGSGAVEAIVTNTGPNPDDADMLDTITTLTADALAMAFGNGRNKTFTLPSGETSVQINIVEGTGGDMISGNVWYEAVATPGATQVGATVDLSGATDWCLALVSVKPAVAAGSVDSVNFMPIRRKRFKGVLAA